MSPEQWDILANYFEKAIELSPGDQEIFLQELSVENASAAEELHSLLHHAGEAQHFMAELNDVVPSLEKENETGGTLKDPYEIIGTRISQYLVLDVIGGGGMGVIYKAKDTDLRRYVALKFLPPDLYADDRARERFISEARAASALDHPNVCAIYEVTRSEDGRLFIVMGYYEGETLKEKIERGPIPLQECLDYTKQIAKGVSAAHQRGIVHRDIKPGNIMVTNQGMVKILDFGIAKYADQQLTKTGMTIGTVAYMSPDLIRGEPPKPATDIWSLGVVLYEMLAGVRPFRGERYEGIMYCILNEEPTYSKDLPSNLPDYVKGIIRNALQKNHRLRYNSLEPLIQDIKTNSTQSLSTIRMSSTQRRSWKTKRTLALVSLGALLMLIWPVTQFFLHQFVGNRVQEQRVAILPFEARPQGNEESEVIAEGLMYTLASTMTYLDSPESPISVIPVSAVRRYGVQDVEGAKKLLDSHLALEGALGKIGNMLNLSLNLIESENMKVLGGDSRQVVLEGGLNPLTPAYQEEVLVHFATILGISLEEEKLAVFKNQFPKDPDAYALYVQGVGYLQRYDKIGYIDYAVGLFEDAIEVDSMYAPAYAGLCESLWLKYEETQIEAWAERALASCDFGAELGIDQASVLIPLSSVYLRTGEYDRAEQTLRRAVELEPENPEAYRWLGRVYFAKIELDSARTNYERAIALRSNNWVYYHDLGIALSEHGLHEESGKQFAIVRKLTPDNYLGVYQQGVVYRNLGQIDKAEAAFKEALEMNPEISYVRRSLGYLYYREQRYLDVVEILDSGVTERDVMSLNYLADAHYWLGNHPIAQDTWSTAILNAEAALAIDPGDRIARCALADALSASGNTDQGIAEIGVFSERELAYPWVAYFASRVYERSGERTKAILSIERALSQRFDVYMFENDPWLSDLRTDPAYDRLREQYLK